MEELYQYLWKSRMFGRRLRESGGEAVEVIDPGRHNHDSGPDFFNSKVRIGGVEWAGNVEIHVRASDWTRHGHDSDPAYDNVILHVVGISDQRVRRSDGVVIPQVEVTLPESFFRVYSGLSAPETDIRCAAGLASLSPLVVTDWLETLAVERLQAKAERVLTVYRNCGNDWQQTCFIILARSFGFGLNSEPFEMLARSLPLTVLHHHCDNPLQLQAILFGQAGMLDSSRHIFDEYYQTLCREYYFLARKYGLRPMDRSVWKYARTRPQNFPHRRIAFLSKACEGGFSLFSDLIGSGADETKLRSLFQWRLDGYWSRHSSFDVEQPSQPAAFSAASVTLLIINAAAPLIYAFSSVMGNPDMGEKVASLLSSLPAEGNGVVRRWASLGLGADDAFRSQALLHLKKEYCDARKCLYCRFGHQLLRTAANR